MTTQEPLPTTDDVEYFDLHTRGVGYLNRVRTVNPPKGDPFVACTIAALVGKASKPEKRYIGMTAVTEEAERLLKRCEDAVNAEKKVLVSFLASDLWADQFVYDRGKKKGETGFSHKMRLLKLYMIKVNNEVVYRAPKKEENEAQVEVSVPAVISMPPITTTTTTPPMVNGNAF